MLFRLAHVAAALLLSTGIFAQAPQAEDWRAVEEKARAELLRHPLNEAAAVLHARALIQLSQPFDAALELEDFVRRKPTATSAGKLYAALLADVVQDRTRAEEVLLACARNAPRDAEIHEALGKLYILRHRYADAIRSLRAAVRLAPAQPLYWAELAKALEKNEAPREAALGYRRALALNRSRRAPIAAVYLLYADYAAGEHNHADAIRYYTQALLLEPHNANAYQARAVAHEGAGNLRGAEADALAALREDPGRKDSRQLLLRAYRANGDMEGVRKQAEALEHVVTGEQASLSAGRRMRAALNQAEALLAAGKFAEAVPEYEKVVAADPSFYEAWFALGVCYGQTGQPAKSEEALRKYLEFQPLSADGHAALGLLLTSKKRNAEARPELERALELNPEAVEPRKALAFLLLDAREFDKAAAALAGVIESGAAPDAETFGFAARAVFGAGRKAEAIGLCEAGLRAFPRAPELESMYATLLSDCSRDKQCRAKAIGALKQNPQSPAYLKMVTAMLIDTAPLDAATGTMVERTLQALPSDPEAEYLRARWSLANNRPDAALAEAAGLERTADPAVRARAMAIAAIAAGRLGRADEAEAKFRSAHALNASLPAPDPAVAIPYADFLIQQSREDEADRVIGDVLRWSPTFLPALLRRATYLANSGKQEEAARVAESLLRQQGADEDPVVLRAAHVLLAKTYTALGRPGEAKPHLDWVTRQ